MALVGEEDLELRVADLRVNQVDTGGLNVDEQVVVANRWFRNIRGLYRPLVLLNEIRLHETVRPGVG